MNILVVDDSSMFRLAISDLIKQIPGVDKVTTAANGKMALDILRSNSIDLTILDVEMPVLDGIEVLKQLKDSEIKTKIIMFSNLTEKGAELTIEALNLGAFDFVTKVTEDGSSGLEAIQKTLIPKVTSLIKMHHNYSLPETKLPKSGVQKGESFNSTQETKALPKFTSSPHLNAIPRILCMGSSTGGPEALNTIFSRLEGPFQFPIVLAQHMPKFFTKKLADHLNNQSSVTVKEAEHGEILQNNVCYIAPGDYHMTVERQGTALTIGLNQDAKVCYVRPSVDVLFWSVAKLKLPHVTAIILTGMGSDGKEGCSTLHQDNHPIVIQDKASSIVWGMPGSIAEIGIQSKEMDLAGVANFINKLK